jgi:precorrin-6B C5,15-methyltransferase / cobalt-precorrin-6B C5,C15-methyltransferase
MYNMQEQKFTIVGMLDASEPAFGREALQAISASRHFSGGRRHYDIVKNLLPAGSQWITVEPPMLELMKMYASINSHIVIFASGNPLFYGIANTVRAAFPKTSINIISCEASIHYLARALLLPIQYIKPVSLTGRTWEMLDRALIAGEISIGVLTDAKHTPAGIAARMLQYGYSNYAAIIGENLGGSNEAITEMGLEQCAASQFAELNCMILQIDKLRPRPWAIPHTSFDGLPGRPNMITKDAYRMMSLAKLELYRAYTFWDIGFCTGSVSIEARLRFPSLSITAFEKREECAAIIQANMEKFGAPGINWLICDFLDADLSKIERPGAVFLGGYSGMLMQVAQRVAQHILPGGLLVFNAVSSDSRLAFIAACAEMGFTVTDELVMSAGGHNPVTIITASARADI